MGRDADVPNFADVTATLSKYGQFYIVNEEVDLYNPNGTTDELVAEREDVKGGKSDEEGGFLLHSPIPGQTIASTGKSSQRSAGARHIRRRTGQGKTRTRSIPSESA